MPPSNRTLTLVRHAKSSWKDRSLADIERPLNGRGRRNAPDMGKWLADQGPGPDHVICSPAKRTRSTAALLAEAMGWGDDLLRIDDRLYFEGTSGMLRALEQTDDRFGRVMMVGHNPVMTRFLDEMTGENVGNMPTCAIAVIAFDMESWGLADTTRGELVAYETPKGLAARS